VRLGYHTVHTPFCAPVSKLGGETPSRIRAWSLIHTEKQLLSLRETAMKLRSLRPLHVQGDDGHPGYQGGGPKKIAK
jgi:hypothetical protein